MRKLCSLHRSLVIKKITHRAVRHWRRLEVVRLEAGPRLQGFQKSRQKVFVASLEQVERCPERDQLVHLLGCELEPVGERLLVEGVLLGVRHLEYEKDEGEESPV
jgi:hypothetical protein